MALAEVFEFDTSTGLVDRVDAAFAMVVEGLRSLPVEDAVTRGQRFQNRLAGVEAELVAARLAAGVTGRQAEKLLGRGNATSTREAKKRVSRATAVEANPDLAGGLANGGLDLDALDALADVNDRSNGAAANDQQLIDRLKAGNPDDAKVTAREWLDDHTTAAEHEARWQHQHRQRRLSRFTTRRGLDAILAEGDTETITELWNTLTTESKQLYQTDGGRNTKPGAHPRTRDQRMFDALHTTITGTTSIVDPDHPASETSRTETAATKPATRHGATPQVFITMTIDDWIDGATRARLIGGGTIPNTLLDRYLEDAQMAGVVFDGDGHVLWHGRNRRYATAAQQSALTARDQGCVICHTHPNACDAHHLIPYNAPAKGQTNLDQLAHVCDNCHHHIHHNQLTLHQQPNPTHPNKPIWKLRPATPNEIPP